MAARLLEDRNMANNPERVELRPAFAWDCPECGVEQFHRGVVPEMSPEDEQEAREALGMESWEEGQLMTAPDSVTCSNCGQTFEAFDFGEDEDEDDEDDDNADWWKS